MTLNEAFLFEELDRVRFFQNSNNVEHALFFFPQLCTLDIVDCKISVTDTTKFVVENTLKNVHFNEPWAVLK